jgi:hypothetical protein
VANRLFSTWDLIGERLVLLHALLTDDEAAVVRERYLAWKDETRAALDGVVDRRRLGEFDRVHGKPPRRDAGRPTPPVYLDAAAARAFLTALRSEIEAGLPADQVSRLKLLELLGRLGAAFRGTPRTERDLEDGFETLLTGASIEYARGNRPGPAFQMKSLATALDLKLCIDPSREGAIVASIQKDIAAWRSSCRHLLIGVYHPGFMSETEFTRVFKSEDDLSVRLIRLS